MGCCKRMNGFVTAAALSLFWYISNLRYKTMEIVHINAIYKQIGERMSEDILIPDRPTEAEIVFNSTTSKKNLSGVRGRASRTGRKGAVMTPVDFLRGKARKEYMQNSEVRVYNMYEEQVLPYEEFKELPVEKQVVLMTKWRDDIGTNNIIKEMKISRKKFYSEILKTLGIETKPRGRRPKRNEPDQEFDQETGMETSAELAPQVRALPMPATAFTVAFSGTCDGHTTANRLGRLARILDADARYEVRVEIRELGL